MFYFLLPTLLTYDFILIGAAVIPAVFLMVKVYRSDRLESESPAMLWSLVRAGIFSALLAMVAERVLSGVLGMTVRDAGLYQVLLYFVVVAFSEEGAKYFLLRRNTWRSSEFNCRYDGVVYAVFVSLGFALWENISYVMHYGFSVAVVRAVTAIPGHTCFGVFMGLFYGAAKSFGNRGAKDGARLCEVLAVLIPALLHGAYDYIASMQTGTGYFILFIAVLFAASYRLVVKMSGQDRYI